MGLTAADIMSAQMITIRPETGIRELAEILVIHKISGAPVTDGEGALAGVVSQTDLVAQNKNPHIPSAITLFDWVIYLESLDRFKAELDKMAGTTVADIMTREVVTVPPGSDPGGGGHHYGGAQRAHHSGGGSGGWPGRGHREAGYRPVPAAMTPAPHTAPCACLELSRPEETRQLGRLLGERLGPGAVVALTGDLGAGKTCLTQGLAIGLGVPRDEPVVSPTFVLAYEYQGRIPLFHLDVYRLSGGDFLDAGLDEYFRRGGVVVVEWADRIEDELPSPRLTIRLSVSAVGGRRAEITSVGSGFETLIRDMAAVWEESRPSGNDA